MDKQHEGVTYLYGQINNNNTLAIGAVRPNAYTTPGSFEVSSLEMAKMVRAIRNNGLQMVGQVHTHPGQAYHSDGDVDGLKMIYDGFISVVLPSYGHYLPSLDGAAVFFYRRGVGFTEIQSANVRIIPSKLL